MAKEHLTSGTRKKAIARAVLREGKGSVMINGISLDTVTPLLAQHKFLEPLVLAGDAAKSVDIEVSINGGGYNSQAEAGRVAIARAFVSFDKKLEKVFMDYDRNILVPDSRQKETRKPGNHGKARAQKPKGKR